MFSSRLEHEPALASDFKRLGWHSASAVARWFALPAATSKAAVQVVQRRLPWGEGQPWLVYYKQYDYPRPAWKFLGRRSKAWCEYRNYAVFASLGIRCARRIACGEVRTGLGRLEQAFLLTQAIPEARPLTDYAQNAPAPWASPATRAPRRAIASQLASMTRRIHQAGFFHNDLVWRNILITEDRDHAPLVWWIDCPRGHYVRWRWRQRHCRIKDLAALDKSAAKWCSRAERLRFLLDYLQKPRLDDRVKRWIRNVLAYRRKRWPDDWQG